MLSDSHQQPGEPASYLGSIRWCHYDCLRCQCAHRAAPHPLTARMEPSLEMALRHPKQCMGAEPERPVFEPHEQIVHQIRLAPWQEVAAVAATAAYEGGSAPYRIMGSSSGRPRWKQGWLNTTGTGRAAFLRYPGTMNRCRQATPAAWV